MKNRNQFNRIIATFFLVIFFPTLVPSNLYASNNTPKSPEAASFEPVDATDMVNLITGQYSYVLPLLNVPSPEGGYPLAMGYHAGIAMDQEASWTGLGWNVNPGAIDRSVNGYPDDYKMSHLNEFFYDSGHDVKQYSISTSYSGYGLKAGVGFNWGSDQALGGYVSIGVGIGADDAGASADLTVGFGNDAGYVGIGVGVFAGGFNVGVNADSNGNAGVNAGFSYGGAGLSVGYNTSGTFTTSLHTANGISLSSSSSGNHSVSVGGIGLNSSFNNTTKMGDYSSFSSSWEIPLVAPTPYGIFSLSYSENEYKYWLGKNVENYVTGPVHYNGAGQKVGKKVWVTSGSLSPNHTYAVNCEYDSLNSTCQYNTNTGQHGVGNVHNILACYNHYDTAGNVFVGKHNTYYPSHLNTELDEAFMDVYDLPNQVNEGVYPEDNNATFPSYDNFNVQAQGLSGSMSSIHYENGLLFGLSGKEDRNGSIVNYSFHGAGESKSTRFDAAKPYFYFDNEISTYINVAPALFNTNSNANILDFYAGGVDLNPKSRRKTSSFIEYYTNEEIINNYTVLKQNGYLQQDNFSGFDRTKMPKNGIGAFKITTVDGKTYHYSLPVYNHEIITRTCGIISERPNEEQAYFEKRQLEPFATHWLLTAVTGPDYVDNGDGIAGTGDLGYWAGFEYGKWTDGFFWKAPYNKDYIIQAGRKTWVRGRKQLYYLDKVKTRTHTALFVKSQRNDDPSPQWAYRSATHSDIENNPVVWRFNVPLQKQLRLDKIILLKNSDDKLDKAFGYDENVNAYIKYNESDKNEVARVNNTDNVIDIEDNWSECVSKAVKVINFNYDYSLAGGTKLTLKSINFNGIAGTNVLPPYKFEYINNTIPADNAKKSDDWGYYKEDPTQWSLNKITTPQGGIVNINYEKHKFYSATPHALQSTDLSAYFTAQFPVLARDEATRTNATLILNRNPSSNYTIPLGQSVDVVFRQSQLRSPNEVTPTDEMDNYVYNWTGKVISIIGNQYKVQLDQGIAYYGGKLLEHEPYEIRNLLGSSYNRTLTGFDFYQIQGQPSDFNFQPTGSKILVTIKLSDSNQITDGGIRVANLDVSDGVNNYITDYKYGKEDRLTGYDGSGYVSYIPNAADVARIIPFSAELPAPRVMYEYVTMGSHKKGLSPNSKIRYKFNVIKSKSSWQLKYDDFYEITSATQGDINSFKRIKSYNVSQNFASIGQLLEVATFNVKGLPSPSQGQLLSKITNTYYTKDEMANNIGKTQESYQSYKIANLTNGFAKWSINSSTRVNYPSIIKSSTEQKNGYTYTTNFTDYDEISGVSKQKTSFSSNGESLQTKMIPAYLKYPDMGSKVDNVNNKNMLSQTAAEYSYIYDATDAVKPWKETGVGITTWNNLWSYKDIEGNSSNTALDLAKDKVWRKHKSYVWNGVKDAQGIFTNYNSVTDDSFNWTLGIGSQPVQWKQTSEVTLYDHYSMALEAKDINGNKAATKMGDNDTKVIATGNAGYNEMFYSGGENLKPSTIWLEPEVKMDNSTQNTLNYHTGERSIATTSTSQFGVLMRAGQHRVGKYKLSVWVENTSAAKATLRVNGAVINFIANAPTAGNWVLKTAYIDVPVGDCTVYLNSGDTSTVYYDDFMLRPIASSISGYVYNQYDQLTYMVGNNGLATFFQYDAAGRLTKTYVEVVNDLANGVTGGFKLKTTSQINYKK
jgi:hypothetical protein